MRRNKPNQPNNRSNDSSSSSSSVSFINPQELPFHVFSQMPSFITASGQLGPSLAEMQTKKLIAKITPLVHQVKSLITAYKATNKDDETFYSNKLRPLLEQIESMETKYDSDIVFRCEMAIEGFTLTQELALHTLELYRKKYQYHEQSIKSKAVKEDLLNVFYSYLANAMNLAILNDNKGDLYRTMEVQLNYIAATLSDDPKELRNLYLRMTSHFDVANDYQKSVHYGLLVFQLEQKMKCKPKLSLGDLIIIYLKAKKNDPQMAYPLEIKNGIRNLNFQQLNEMLNYLETFVDNDYRVDQEGLGKIVQRCEELAVSKNPVPDAISAHDDLSDDELESEEGKPHQKRDEATFKRRTIQSLLSDTEKTDKTKSAATSAPKPPKLLKPHKPKPELSAPLAVPLAVSLTQDMAKVTAECKNYITRINSLLTEVNTKQMVLHPQGMKLEAMLFSLKQRLHYESEKYQAILKRKAKDVEPHLELVKKQRKKLEEVAEDCEAYRQEFLTHLEKYDLYLDEYSNKFLDALDAGNTEEASKIVDQLKLLVQPLIDLCTQIEKTSTEVLRPIEVTFHAKQEVYAHYNVSSFAQAAASLETAQNIKQLEVQQALLNKAHKRREKEVARLEKERERLRQNHLARVASRSLQQDVSEDIESNNAVSESSSNAMAAKKAPEMAASAAASSIPDADDYHAAAASSSVSRDTHVERYESVFFRKPTKVTMSDKLIVEHAKRAQILRELEAAVMCEYDFSSKARCVLFANALLCLIARLLEIDKDMGKSAIMSPEMATKLRDAIYHNDTLYKVGEMNIEQTARCSLEFCKQYGELARALSLSMLDLYSKASREKSVITANDLEPITDNKLFEQIYFSQQTDSHSADISPKLKKERMTHLFEMLKACETIPDAILNPGCGLLFARVDVCGVGNRVMHQIAIDVRHTRSYEEALTVFLAQTNSRMVLEYSAAAASCGSKP
ncbi:MAG: hypothetical protein P4L65_04420 [Legionella sp.]|nr:hypothetical protein [Legionella sp.]